MTYLEQIAEVVGKSVSMTTGPDLEENEFEVSLTDKSDRYRTTVVRFSLEQLPGCCGVCVAYHVTVGSPYRNRGLGALVNKMIQQMAYRDGYTILMGTDRDDNYKQQRIFLKEKWTRLFGFENKRTDNPVSLYTKVLTDSGVDIGHPDFDEENDDE